MSDYILIEINDNNELRADIGITIGSLNINNIQNINVKIDTGCPYTSIPIQKLGISYNQAQQMKQNDSNNSFIDKRISFGVNDSMADRIQAKRDFKARNYMKLKNITFEHTGFELDFNGLSIKMPNVRVSYDRIGNILIGMDILSELDIHISESKILNKTVMIACPKNNLNKDYLNALNKHFDLDSSLLDASITQYENI